VPLLARLGLAPKNRNAAEIIRSARKPVRETLSR
jgi:hypothetical protein